MNDSYEFLKSILNTITEHIVVIDSEGNILYVNEAWKSFGRNNGCLTNETWLGINYLEECEKSKAVGEDFGVHAANGIRAVVQAEQQTFYLEYPCHSSEQVRWFMMRVTPFTIRHANY